MRLYTVTNPTREDAGRWFNLESKRLFVSLGRNRPKGDPYRRAWRLFRFTPWRIWAVFAGPLYATVVVGRESVRDLERFASPWQKRRLL